MTVFTKTPHQQRVEEFMRKAGQLSLSDRERRRLWGSLGKYAPELGPLRLSRARLILEEALEVIEGLGVCLQHNETGEDIVFEDIDLELSGDLNIVKAVDGCIDSSVVTNGTLIALGVPDEAFLVEVDRANLDKFRGDAHLNEATGKWIKPSDFVPPRIAELLIELTKND